MTRRPRKVSGAAAPALARAAALVPTLLLATPDPADRDMIRDALLEGTGPADLRHVAGLAELEELLAGPREAPHLVLLDDAVSDDAVRAVRSNPSTRRTPVVVLARDLSPERVAALYEAGANTVLAKPVTFLALVKLMKVFTAYWLDAAELP